MKWIWKNMAIKKKILRQKIVQHNRIHSNHTISLFCLSWNTKICEKNKVTSVNIFIGVNIIEFHKTYRYAWRKGFLTFVLVVCYYSISFFIAFFLFLFFNLTFYLISSSYDQKSSIFKFFYHLYTRYIIIIQNHQRFEYYTFQKNHLRKFNLCSKLKSENKISNFSDQMSMSQKKRKVLIDHPLWFLEILEMKVSLIF